MRLPALLLGGLAACATPTPATDREAVEEFRANNDLLEPMNRALFMVHAGIDLMTIRPS